MPRSVRLLGSALALAALLLLSACGTKSGGTTTSTSTTPNGPVPVPVNTAWPLPADMSAAAAQAGLPMLSQEALTVHYHAHLDVIVRGTNVPVPAYIGIDVPKQKISPLHTHDTSGVVHIESAKDIPFTIGQFFTEWGQPLTAHQVGPILVGQGEEVRIYENGKQLSGDPAALKLAKHAEIVVWVGTASEHPTVPAQYTFAAGL